MVAGIDEMVSEIEVTIEEPAMPEAKMPEEAELPEAK
jgi:hypothetical protein